MFNKTVDALLTPHQPAPRAPDPCFLPMNPESFGSFQHKADYHTTVNQDEANLTGLEQANEVLKNESP
jgi:hypothetical protein